MQLIFLANIFFHWHGVGGAKPMARGPIRPIREINPARLMNFELKEMHKPIMFVIFLQMIFH